MRIFGRLASALTAAGAAARLHIYSPGLTARHVYFALNKLNNFPRTLSLSLFSLALARYDF